MALNDIEQPRNLVVVNATAGVGEGSVNLATSGKSGRLPLDRVKVRPRPVTAATDFLRVALKAGGPYLTVAALETADLGAFAPGDAATLFHIRTGGVDVPFDILIWS